MLINSGKTERRERSFPRFTNILHVILIKMHANEGGLGLRLLFHPQVVMYLNELVWKYHIFPLDRLLLCMVRAW